MDNKDKEILLKIDGDRWNDEEFRKEEAVLQLFCELNAGIRSAEEDGWISEEEMRKHFYKGRPQDQ